MARYKDSDQHALAAFESKTSKLVEELMGADDSPHAYCSRARAVASPLIRL